MLSVAKIVGVGSGGAGIQNGTRYGPGQYPFLEKRINVVNKVKYINTFKQILLLSCPVKGLLKTFKMSMWTKHLKKFTRQLFKWI